jgi:hypothetical protein
LADKVFDTYKPFVSDNRQTFACDRLVGIDVKESFFRYEPRKLDWRRYWIDQHVPGLRRWSFKVIENEKIELLTPKVPVRLVPLREQEPDAPAESSPARPEPSKRRPPSAEATEVAE